MTGRRIARILGRVALVVAGVLVIAPLVSREVRFVYRGGWELARLQWRARSIQSVLDDPRTDSAQRVALGDVVAARSYAADSLGLVAGRSYRRFTDVGRDTLVLVLSASAHDTLAPYTWWFPITGRVPYHGYYSFDAARRAATRLRDRGLDTYLRVAPAFSTLGWLPDPLFSTALAPPPWMAVTVIHELLHNTVWVAGEVVFNESLAELIGYRGAEAFYRARGDTALANLVARGWDAERITARIQAALVAALNVAFADGVEPDARERLRTSAFASADSSLHAVGLPGSRALRTAIAEENNAAVIAGGIYHGDLDGLDHLYQVCGADVRQVVTAVRAVTLATNAPVPSACLDAAREVVPKR